MCLTCFLGFCTGKNAHSAFHSQKTGHNLFLRVLHHKPATDSAELTTLGIGVEGGYQEPSEKGETTVSVYCAKCDKEFEAVGSVRQFTAIHS